MTLGRVFVDTGAWFALQVQDDAHHKIAREIFPTFDRHFATAGFMRIPGELQL